MDCGRVQAKLARVAACLAVIVLVACGQIPQAGVHGSPAGTSSSPSRVSSTPVASPTPTAARPLPTPTTFASAFGTCRLPVLVPHPPGETPGGWLDVPAGTYTPDPKTTEVAQKANGVMAWDPAVGQWVPTYPKWISPDGTKYVAANLDVVDARTSATLHRISSPNGPNDVIAYTSTAIYMAATGQQPPPGVWKVDTATWTMTEVSSAQGFWDVADDTAVWGTYGSSVVRRLDLSTGVVSDVYRAQSRDGSAPHVWALAGSGVLVTLSYGGMAGSQLDSVVVVHSDGAVVPVEVPFGLQHGDLVKAFQDGAAVLFWAYYPLSWPAVPPDPHAWGLAAYDPDHGLQLLLTNTQADMYFEGRCVV
jgi:hypothetical protein